MEPGQGKSNIVSFSAEGKKGNGSSAVSRTTRRPAEVLREGSGIKVWRDGDGLTISTYIKDAADLLWQKDLARADLSSAGAEQ